jgi:hypothetical protein
MEKFQRNGRSASERLDEEIGFEFVELKSRSDVWGQSPFPTRITEGA